MPDSEYLIEKEEEGRVPIFKRRQTYGRQKSMIFIVYAVALIIIALWTYKMHLINKTASLFSKMDFPKKRNIIFMISDGFGPTSETFARDYYQHVVTGGKALPAWDSDYPKRLPLDTIIVGQSRTRSASSWVTDSAAGATAFSCGLKTYNGAIAVNSSQVPCATVMEAAKAKGYTTGLVVTSRITHATPASFSSHVTWRDYEAEIALHQLGETPFGHTIDLMFGGGLCYFRPKQVPDSCRVDDRDLVHEATHKFGYRKFITTRREFNDVENEELPLIGLFHNDHMNYEIDRNHEHEPSLWEMADTALKMLTKTTAKSEEGFFLMIEGSRIDMAAHDNDAGAHAHEILAYQKTIEVVKRYVDENPGTVVISVSDHETGGLSLGRQLNGDYPQYLWYPEVVARQRNSTAFHAKLILELASGERADFVRNVIFPLYTGIEDFNEEDVLYLANPSRTAQQIMWYLADMLNRRALLGWATHGHSGVDVNLYAYAGANYPHVISSLRRNLENIELGWFVEEYLGLDKSLMHSLNDKLIEAWKKGQLRTHPADKPPIPERSLKTAEADEWKKTGDDRFHHFLI